MNFETILSIFSADFLSTALIPLLSLTAIEIVLGIDNIVFLTLIVHKLPANYQSCARTMGLLFAMITRIALLFSITWLMKFNAPIFTIYSIVITEKSLILIAGGLFLVVKSIGELRYTTDEDDKQDDNNEDEEYTPPKISIWRILLIVIQIAIMDIVFSLDSIITAVGLVNDLRIMVCAIVIAVIVMLFAADPVGKIIKRLPQLRCHALCFLILVGLSIIGEALGFPMPKMLIYTALIYSLFTEYCVTKTVSR